MDPIESAKIHKGPKKATSTPAPVEPVVVAPPTPVTEVMVRFPAMTATKKRYRIGREAQVSVNGCLTTLMAGQIIDSQHWGDVAIEKLRSQCVEMTEVA